MRRESIGPNKQAAEQRLREVLSALTEGRCIWKSPDAITKFADSAACYWELPEVMAKKSYKRDCQTVKSLLACFGDKILSAITPGMVEAYRQKRLATASGRTPATLVAPASVNREVSCLRTVFNKAIKDNRAEPNPLKGIRMLQENHVRDRVLTDEEYTRLLANSADYLKPIVMVGYLTGMRKGEILNLTWGQVDLQEEFIRLRPDDTKTNEGRLVPLNPELAEMFKARPQGFPRVRVFTRNGQPLNRLRESFSIAGKRAGLENFCFHDLRPCAVNNWRLRGLDYFLIMAATGPKTMNVFKRYNTVKSIELKKLVSKKG